MPSCTRRYPFRGLRPCDSRTSYRSPRRTFLTSCHGRLFASHSVRLVSSFQVLGQHLKPSGWRQRGLWKAFCQMTLRHRFDRSAGPALPCSLQRNCPRLLSLGTFRFAYLSQMRRQLRSPSRLLSRATQAVCSSANSYGFFAVNTPIVEEVPIQHIGRVPSSTASAGTRGQVNSGSNHGDAERPAGPIAVHGRRSARCTSPLNLSGGAPLRTADPPQSPRRPCGPKRSTANSPPGIQVDATVPTYL